MATRFTALEQFNVEQGSNVCLTMCSIGLCGVCVCVCVCVCVLVYVHGEACCSGFVCYFRGVYADNITFAYYIHKVALVTVLCCRAFNSKFKRKWLHHHNRLYTVCINVMLANEG